MPAQLSFDEIQTRLGNMMLTIWQLGKEMDELRAENAALRVQLDALKPKEEAPESPKE